MYQSVKFLSLASASFLIFGSFPQPLRGTTFSPVSSNLQAQQIQNSETEAGQLSQKGIVQLNSRKLPEAARTFEQALEIYRELDSRFGKDSSTRVEEVNTLINLVKVYTFLKDPKKTIDFSQKTLEKARKIGDRDTELKLLITLGDAHNSLAEYKQAVESATAGLALAQKLDNSKAKAAAFVTLASAYQSLASSNREYRKATDAAISGLTTAWKAKDPESEAKALAILGSSYNSLSNPRNALVFAQQGLKVAEENNIPSAAASSLLTLASVHLEEGNYPKVIELTKQSRDYLQRLQQRETEGATLVIQGLAYYGQGSAKKSLEFAEQGLAIAREVKSPLIEALGLIVLSLDSSDAGNFPKAIESINQSRTIAKEQHNRDLESFTLEVLGGIYRKSGDKEQAIASYQEAISLNDSYTATAGLARIYQDANLLGTAITYYKQAINKNEEKTPRWIPGLPDWLQEAFPKAVQELQGLRTADIYRSLTNLLLLQRRIPEAQEVLELLKQDELREYGGNTEVRTQPLNLTMTPTEEEILKNYGSLIAFGQRLDDCQQTRCDQLGQLLEQRTALTHQYYRTLEQLETAISDRTISDKAFVNPTQFALKAQAIVEEQPNTVLIYPIVLQDKIWLLWASKGGIFKSVEVTGVSQAQLEVTVLRFRQLIQNRFSDINELKATGKQLYGWLIEPLEKELKANDIHNLVFSLDSATRYIPMSALFDGENYLVENYSVSTVISANLTKTQPVLSSPSNTPKATANVSEAAPLYSCGEGCRLSLSSTEPNNSGSSGVPLPNTQNPRILGLGVSEAVAGFQPLPNVPAELDSIVRQEASDSTGIYPGQKFLDKTFDFFALRDNLSGRQILHIATHSEFVPGRAYKSFLLLGTGEKLAIPDIETWLNLHDINLVVLSACETALGGPGLDGRELMGMGYYFLKGGARTVMASLWHVDDLSTRLLMEQFYKNLARGTLTSPVAKSNALRQAQLALLDGKYTTDAQTQSSLLLQRLSAMRSSSVTQPGENLPLSTNVNNKNFFSHPYYWAPFILMGSGL